MGCLKKLFIGIIKKIIIIALIIAFFAFGGYAFLKDNINKYQNPAREDFIKTETNYADFSLVPSDYQLCRNYNLFGYKKIHAKYLPTGQKITIFDLKNEDRISASDFESNKIDKKINDILDKLKDAFITFEDFKIVNKGYYQAKNKKIPYIKFTAKVKNMPFKNVTGVIAAYSTQNKNAKKQSTKLIITMTDTKAFNPTIPSGFITALKF